MSMSVYMISNRFVVLFIHKHFILLNELSPVQVFRNFFCFKSCKLTKNRIKKQSNIQWRKIQSRLGKPVLDSVGVKRFIFHVPPAAFSPILQMGYRNFLFFARVIVYVVEMKPSN